MTIRRFTAEQKFTPEQRRILESAFNATLRKLSLVDRGDPVCEIVAKKIIQIGATGLSNAAAISDIAVKQLDPR
jgi:hypothetical protein